MRAMFDKLNPRMTESEEISYAHRNLIPRLHLAINRNDVDDYTHLEYLANVAQKSYRVARSYKPPPTPERSLLPDLAYKDPRYKRTNKPNGTRTERMTFLGEDEESSLPEDLIDHVYLSMDKNTESRPPGNPRGTPRVPPPVTKPTVPTTPEPVPPALPSAQSTPTRDYNPNFKCWNCHELGHGYTICKQPKTRFCFGCGKKGVIKPECPNCSGN